MGSRKQSSENIWSAKAKPLEKLLNAIASKRALSRKDLDLYKGVPTHVAITQLRKLNRKQEVRQRVAFVYSLTQSVADKHDLSNAVEAAAFSFFRFHLVRPGSNQSEGMAWAEMCLNLSDSLQKKARWVENVQNFYIRCLNKEVVPDFKNATGISSDEVRSLLSAVRSALGKGEFELPRIQSNPVIERPSMPDDGGVVEYLPIVGKISSTRIKNISITNFRGVPGPLNIDFCDSGGQAQTVLITGDNGVGKSTIVSAIEFVCQASVGRRSNRNGPTPQTINLSTGLAQAEVSADLTDGRLIQRIIERKSTTQQNGRIDPLDEFTLAPISLQRSDIIRFLATSPQERGVLFVDHFSADMESAPVGEKLAVAQEKLAELQRERNALRKSIAQSHNLPAGLNPQELVSRAYFDGLTKAQFEDRYGKRVSAEAAYMARKLQELGRQIRGAKNEIKGLAPSKNMGAYELRVKRLAALLGSIDAPLTAAFHAVTGIEWVKQIRLRFGESGAVSIDLDIELENGEFVAPEQIFSEGYQDLVAFLFFLEVARAAARRGQARVLILDDVFQSVDATVRVSLLDYALKELKGWQLFITIHDMLWKSQLLDLLRRHGFPVVEREVRRWDFNNGPTVVVGGRDMAASLNQAIADGNIPSICSEAGRLLEKTCDQLSHLLPVSVTRRQGDKYTLGDLWPPIAKKLKKTSLRDASENLEKWLHLRNLVGAHYNEWAESLSLAEAERFGEATQRFYESVFCGTCSQWIRESPQVSTWVCRCGLLTIGPAGSGNR